MASKGAHLEDGAFWSWMVEKSRPKPAVQKPLYLELPVPEAPSVPTQGEKDEKPSTDCIVISMWGGDSEENDEDGLA
jgi:hypothetical protein